MTLYNLRSSQFLANPTAPVHFGHASCKDADVTWRVGGVEPRLR